MRRVVAALLPILLLPLAAAQGAGITVDATVDVTADGSVTLTSVVGGLGNGAKFSGYRVPEGATFLRATDADGSVVSHVVADAVDFTSRGKPVSLVFQMTPVVEGTIMTIDVSPLSASAGAATTLGIRLPPDHGVLGAKDRTAGDPVEVDASGVFRTTGGGYFSYVVTTDVSLDAGPDPRISGKTIRREGFANVTDSGATLTIVTTYDTDVFGRDTWTFPIPEGGSVLRASSPFGALTTTPDPEGVRVRTPYPFGHGLGARPFTVEFALPAPERHGGAFVQANFSIRAASGDDVSIVAAGAEGLRYAGARASGGNETAPMRFEADGPLTIGLAFLPPAAAGHTQFDEGIFVVDAPTPLAAAARATARNASELLPVVASFAHDPADARPFYVSYTEADIFSWEEGFYSNGLNTISIRADTLANATDGKPHLVPVGVLVHEATHGLLDRRLPDAPHDLSFLHEGLSRLAETYAEQRFPVEPEVVSCRQVALKHECDRHSARPGAEEIRDRYRGGAFTFDVAWAASEVSDAERGFLYDFSGFVLHAFDKHAPEGALENALAHVARTRFDGASDSGVLLDILRANAPGVDAQALLYPHGAAASLSLGEFQYCLGDLLAPPYPWQEEDVRAPSGGCPPTGYGSPDAELPPPPPEPVTPTPSTPVPVSPPPRISPPLVTTPESGDRPPAGEVPGAEVEPTAPGSATPAIVVPGPAVFAVLAAILVVAIARRR